jgi:hypothetical protein
VISHRRTRLAAGFLAAVAGLTACTSEPGANAVPDTAPSAAVTPPPAAPVVQEDVGEVPLARDSGYEDAVGTFGAEEVAAASTNAARVAHIALADCVRWRTGAVDPRLADLLAPSLVTRVTEELDRPPGTVPSLLSHLPADDGNGHRLASDVALGCDGTAPLRYPMGPVAVAVDGTGDTPRLVLTGSFVMDVAFGPTRVQAAQDWVLTSERSDAGWRLADAASSAHVNWIPPR